MNDKERRGPAPQGQEEATEPSLPIGSALDLQIVKRTDVGRLRPHNEDYIDDYVPSDPQQRASKGVLLLVADGMGGHQAGEVASKDAVEQVIAQYYDDTSHEVGTSLVRAFRAANQQIYSQAQADAARAGMGTTLVAAAVVGHKVYVANVGDSRAYLVNEEGISQITEDHSWVEEQVRAGLLSSEQASRHPQRNLLTRALGSKPMVDVDLFEGELGDRDTLLLCTDGLTGRVEDEEIAGIIQEHPPEEAARLLIARANERGGNDNITVLLVCNRQETATVARPVLAKEPKKGGRPLSLVPVLGAAAGLLVLALIALLASPVLIGSKSTPTPTPTHAQTEPTVPAAGTVGPGQVPGTTPGLTATLAVATGETAVSPTATLVPTFTQTPPTTPVDVTSSPSPLDTAVVSPTEGALTEPAPTLGEPEEGIQVSGIVTFAWSYERPLPSGSEFQVLVWPDGAVSPGDPAGKTTDSSLRINLAEILQIADSGPGQYYWTVVVVDIATGARISPEPFARHFIYSEAQLPASEPAQPQGTSVP